MIVGAGFAAAVGIAALGSAIGTPALPQPLADLDQRLPSIFKIHMVASGLALFILPWVLFLRHQRSLHRVLGRICAGLLFIGAAASVPSALQSAAMPLARVGFFTQGLLCLTFVVGAVRAVRSRNIEQHARLMLGVSALVFGAVILRIMMALAMWLGSPFDLTYAALAWLSWLIPLLMVSLWPRLNGLRSPGLIWALIRRATANGRLAS